MGQTLTLFDGPSVGLAVFAVVAVALLLLVALRRRGRGRLTSMASRRGERLSHRLEATLRLLETACDIAEADEGRSQTDAARVRESALAFRGELDDVLAELDEYLRTTIADLPVPGGGLPGLLADEAYSLRLAALVASTRMLARGLSSCDDLTEGMDRLRAAVDRITEELDIAVAASQLAEARAKA